MTNQEIIETIKYLNFCGLCTTGDCMNCARKIAKDKVLELLEKTQQDKQKLKVFVASRKAGWCEDDAIAVLAVDKLHAERCARCNSDYFRKGKVEVTEVKMDKGKVILISNTGA